MKSKKKIKLEHKWIGKWVEYEDPLAWLYWERRTRVRFKVARVTSKLVYDPNTELRMYREILIFPSKSRTAIGYRVEECKKINEAQVILENY